MVYFFGIYIFLILIITKPQAQCRAFNVQSRASCITGVPDHLLLWEHRRLGSLEPEDESAGSESREILVPIEIDTWFHIVSSEAAAELVSDEMVKAQVSCHDRLIQTTSNHDFGNLTMEKLSALQSAYGNASISYRLQGVTRSVNDTWARNGDDLVMKNELRKGGYSTLNIYFQTDLQTTHDEGDRLVSGDRNRENNLSATLASMVLGFCTMPDPSINASSSRPDYVKDGCNVLARTMPGGPLTGYNRGGTTIHEVGHWNGLLHTFQGESCSSGNEGDYIADTPQEAVPTEGCPLKKNSCPDSPGVDAIHNFMDYSSDECYESFTPGQMKRMRNMWSSVRGKW